MTPSLTATQPTQLAEGATRAVSAPDASREARLAELVAHIRAGDTEALGQLYRETRPAVARYLTRRMEVCPADVEDVVQETYLRAPEMAADFKPATTEVGAWLCGRVANWTLVDFYRKQRFVQHAAVDAAIDAARRGPVESSEQRESRPLSSRVLTALARLTPAQRRAVQLRYLDGYSNETAAELVGSSPGALAQNAMSARRRLAKELGDLADRPVPWVATVPHNLAVQAALAETGNDMPAALAWLRRKGVHVDESYAYQVRKGSRTPRRTNEKETAVRDALARLGVCDAATVQTQLAEHGIEVSKSYINKVRAEVGAPLPTNKHTVVRAALAELDTTDAAAVQAHLRERGIEVSKSYINQVRRTPTPETDAERPEAQPPVDTSVSSQHDTARVDDAPPAQAAQPKALQGPVVEARGQVARLHQLDTDAAVRAAFDAVGHQDVTSAVAWLRDRGVRVSSTRVAQARAQLGNPPPASNHATQRGAGQAVVTVPNPRTPHRAASEVPEQTQEETASRAGADPPGSEQHGQVDRSAAAVEQARQAVARLRSTSNGADGDVLPGNQPWRWRAGEHAAENASDDESAELTSAASDQCSDQYSEGYDAELVSA